MNCDSMPRRTRSVACPFLPGPEQAECLRGWDGVPPRRQSMQGLRCGQIRLLTRPRLSAVSAPFAKLHRTNLVLARPPEKLGMLGKCLADCRCCRCCSLRFRLVHGVASRFVPVVEFGYEQAMRVQSLARKLGMARYISTKC